MYYTSRELKIQGINPDSWKVCYKDLTMYLLDDDGILYPVVLTEGERKLAIYHA